MIIIIIIITNSNTNTNNTNNRMIRGFFGEGSELDIGVGERDAVRVDLHECVAMLV